MIAFAFGIGMRGSVAGGVALEMIDLPGVPMCYDCAKEVEIAARLAPCPD